MPGKRKKGKKRVDFFLDEEERRVFGELKNLSSADSMAEVLRYMLEQAAKANGIVPPRRLVEGGGEAVDWTFARTGKQKPTTRKGQNK